MMYPNLLSIDKFFIFDPKNLVKYLILLILFFYASLIWPIESYFLCGPDEDGCPKDGYYYCFCIPMNKVNANVPYCLNFDNLTCQPLVQAPKCQKGFVFKDQGSCLATIYQSHSNPPCYLVTKRFCLTNAVQFCGENGDPKSCKPGV